MGTSLPFALEHAPDLEVTDPDALLEAAGAGAPLVRLDAEVERLVERALRERTWGTLSAASRALRTLQSFAREDSVHHAPRGTS